MRPRRSPSRRPLFALAALALGGALALPSAALADDAMPSAPPPAPAPKPPPAAPVSGKFFDAYDRDQDGKVTRTEFLGEKGDEEVFGLLDADDDGVVTLEEVGLPPDYKPKPLPPPSAGDAKRPGPGGGAAGERLRRIREEFLAMDADKDGKVSRDEYKGKRPFEALDKNKDGFLSADDFAGARDGMSPEQRFKERDKNGDGKLSADEVPDAARFKEMDADGDGAVTVEEMRAAPPGRGDAGRLRGDKDGDGKISRAEFPGGDEAFRGLDANGDGVLTRDELAKKRPGPDAPATPPGGSAPGGRPPEGERTGGGLFSILDKDGDGRLSRSEFPGDDAAWRRLDADANGWITPVEAGR